MAEPEPPESSAGGSSPDRTSPGAEGSSEVGSGKLESGRSGSGRAGAPDESFAEAEFLDALSGWAAGQRVAGAASARSRLRFLNEAAAGSATLTGVLVDLAERSAEVVLCVGAAPDGGPYPPGHIGPLMGSRLGGRLVGIGRDFCVLEQNNGRPAVVRTSSLTAVWPLEGPVGTGAHAAGAGGSAAAPVGTAGPGRQGMGSSMPAGARTSPLALSFMAVLADLAAERAMVSIHTPAGHMEGELLAVGEDVVTLRVRAGGGPRRLVHVAAAASLCCELR